MNDLIETTRPTDDGLAGEWTPSLRRQVLTDVQTGRRHPGLIRRRRWPVAVAASVAASLVLAVPVAFPGWFGRTAAAEELAPVAQAAAEQPRLEWTEDQFLHVRTEAVQTDALGTESADDLERRVTFDDYRTVDGWTWSDRTIESTNGQDHAERYIFSPNWGWMRPGYAATMPTEPHLLDAFLRARVAGSTSQDEAVFVAIGDMLRAEAADPQLRAAAISVLGLNPKVTVEHTTDPHGRNALMVTFVDEARRGDRRQVLYLDPDTGALLAEGDTWSQNSYETVVTERNVVDALPADLAAALGTEKVAKEVTDGQTWITPDEPIEDPKPGVEQSYTPAPKR